LSEKRRDEQGNLQLALGSDEIIDFSIFYNYGLELAEIISLSLLLINTIVNFILRKSLRETKVRKKKTE
jgi:hypothetical protein